MANFQKAPESLLKTIPRDFTDAWKDVLKRPGTYSLFDEAKWECIVPNVETPGGGDKGLQTRLIGMWGGEDGGHRLQVKADPEIVGLSIELVSETPVAPHLWLWSISAAVPKCLIRAIETKIVGLTMTATPGRAAGSVFAGALPLKITPEFGMSSLLPTWGGGTRDQTRDAIIAECTRQGVALDTQAAYLLATAEHECGFRPIREGQFGTARPQASETFRRALSYYPYYGRGYVQLTHKRGYQNYATRLGLDLVNDPDLGLQPNVALFILVHGVMNGSFGQALTRFLNDRQTDFLHARKSVNAMDKAAHIAALAEAWLTWIRANRRGVFRVGFQAHPAPHAHGAPGHRAVHPVH